jgi:HAE1 family hydrophobic/amphiphilic exporter-1
MTIWDLCIRRPIFTAMLVSAPVVLGVVSYFKLGVDLFPNADLPIVTVTTTLRGAGAEEMETGVTRPVEEAVNTVAGIEELRSTTREGHSQVVVRFVLEKNGAVAAQEVDAKVRAILGQLPPGTDPPVIDRFDVDAAPVMTVAVSGRRDPCEVTEIARKRIKEDLETLPGVGAVVLVGGRQRAVNVVVDPDRLLKYPAVSIETVRQALLRENVEQPGGRVAQGKGEVVLRTLGRVETAADFGRLIVANVEGQPVRVEDVGRAEESFEEPRGLGRLWSRQRGGAGDNAVSLVVRKQSGTNTVQVVETVKKRLRQIQEVLARENKGDVTTEVIRDQSRFIRRSMDEVQWHLLLAAVLVSLTILLFIRDWRTTVIATLAIPTSLVGTFAFMQFMGFTLNNITMLGLILAVGIVIDDAVVVHENIFRHLEEYGRSAREAAATATREIALAVVATTLSLLVIFVPVAFMQGVVGRFFSSFGWVVGFSVLLSMAVSFTMTPMLCAHFLKVGKGHRPSKGGWCWRLIERGYGAVLAWSLRHRGAVVLIALGTLLATPVLFRAVGKDFVPRDDQGEFEVAVTLPEGCSLERADETFAEIEERLHQLPAVTHTFTTIGDTTGRAVRGQGDVTRGTIYCRLPELGSRPYSQFDVMAQARELLEDYPDLRCTVQDVAAFQSAAFRSVDVDLNVRGPDVAKLEKYSQEVAAWMRGQGCYVDVDTSLSLRKPELRAVPDREKLSDLGVPLSTLSATLNVLVGGEPVGKYRENDELFDVWLRAEPAARGDRAAIERLTVPSAREGVGEVQLENVARFEYAQGPDTVERSGRTRQVVVSANLNGVGLGEGVRRLGDHLREMNLPPDYSFEFVGRAKTLAESDHGFLIAFGLSFLFAYLILAAQFESLVHPVTILLALPLTVPFALLGLLLLGCRLDVYAVFGLFMLFGIVKKNGILQVDYTNVLRSRGVERDRAILEANHTRLRPILMTTVMLVAAMIPLALGQGPGAAARAGMAKLIVGGQALSLLLTLVVTPVAYSLWDDLGRWWTRLRGRTPIGLARPASPGVAPPAPEEATDDPGERARRVYPGAAAGP